MKASGKRIAFAFAFAFATSSFIAVNTLCPMAVYGRTLPLASTRSISFDTNEGTWMSVDVSPDGETVAFDMLGDIYTVPKVGGRATRLTPVGLAVARFPRFSPDGRHIAYVSDADGTDQVWVVDRDGRNPRQITHIGDVRATPPWMPPVPSWTSDGHALIIPDSRHGTISLVQYSLSGSASNVINSGDCTIAAVPTFSPNRTRMFVPCEGARRGTFGTGIAVIDTSSGRLIEMRPTQGRVFSLQVSPDGRWLVYASRLSAAPPETERVTLWRSDLAHSENHDASLGLVDLNIQSVKTAVRFPNFAVTPNSREVIISSGGSLESINLQSGLSSRIPFEAHVEKHLGPLTAQARRLDDGPLRVNNILDPQYSPDGRRVAFWAVGKVWIQEDGRVRRVTDRALNDAVVEFDPSFSPDGEWLTFSTWSEADGGRLWNVPARGGAPILLTRGAPEQSRSFASPLWTPDGRHIVTLLATVRFTNLSGLGLPYTRSFEGSGRLAVIDAGGDSLRVLPTPEIPLSISDRPEWIRGISLSGDGQRAFYWTPASDTQITTYSLHSIGLDATDASQARTHLSLIGFRLRGNVSPDGRWVAVEDHNNIWLVPLDLAAAEAPTLSVSGNCPHRMMIPDPCPARSPQSIRVTTSGGLGPIWLDQGRSLAWHFANRLYRAPLRALLRNAPAGSVSESPVELTVPRARPSGRLLLTGARVITMSGGLVYEHGDILISGRRILAVGRTGEIEAQGATVMDMTGRTIVPGFIGLQNTVNESSSATPFSDPDNRHGLETGMTTIWSPGFGTEFLRSRDQAREVGALIVSRNLAPGCGPVMPPYEIQLDSLDDAIREFGLCARLDGGTRMQEIYLPSTRIQRQWAVMAGRELGVAISAEPGGFHQRISELLDGMALIEHEDAGVRYHRDMIELLARSGTAWNIDGDPWTKFSDRNYLGPIISRGVAVGVSEENNGRIGAPMATNEGAVGGALGLYEAIAGMRPIDGLSLLTINAARALGLERDVGTIEAGKIADLVILEGNPLSDLHLIQGIRYVVQDGYVYSAPSLERRWPAAEPTQPDRRPS